VDGQLAYAAYLRKDYPVARALVTPYLEEPGSSGAYLQAFNLLIQIARDENDDAEGLRISRKAVKGGNPSPMVRSTFAEFLLKSKKPGEVEEGEKVLADLAQQDRPGALLAADTWQRLERFGRAVEVAKTALEKYPEDPDLLFRLGASLEREQKGGEAVGVFERLLKVKPEHAAAMNYLGYYWADRGENLEKARAMIQKAVDLDPGNGAYLDSLGWVLYKLDRLEEAEKFLKEAAALTPDDPTILDHLGDVAIRKGEVDKARDLWRKALTMKPEDGGKKLEEKLRKAEGGGSAPR
jgi:tetratricopeptide (TPR) repeat protein